MILFYPKTPLRPCTLLCLCGLYFFGLTGSRPAAGELTDTNPAPLLNEIMASNTSTIKDRDGDDADDLFKWVFPKSLLPPGGFKLVFASGKNYPTEGQHFHTNFKIKSAGET